jgi:glycine oxidase
MLEYQLPVPPVRHVVFGAGGYLVPRADGRVLVGSTDERIGYDKDVTPAGTVTLRERAARLCPALDGREPSAAWAGLRPALQQPGDGLPLVGPSTISGLTIATGHYRDGILLAPITAELVVTVVAGAPPRLSAV